MNSRVTNQEYYAEEERLLTENIPQLPIEQYTGLTEVELEDRLSQAYQAFNKARNPQNQEGKLLPHTRHEIVAETRFGKIISDNIEINIAPSPNQPTMYLFGGGIAGSDNSSPEACALAAIGYRVVIMPSILSSGVKLQLPGSREIGPLYIKQLRRYEQLYGSFSADGEIQSKLILADQEKLRRQWEINGSEYTGKTQLIGISAGSAIIMRVAGRLAEPDANGLPKHEIDAIHLASPAGVYSGHNYTPLIERDIDESIDRTHYLARRLDKKTKRVLGIATGFGLDTVRVMTHYQDRTSIVKAVGDDQVIKPHITMPWLAARCAENVFEQEALRISCRIIMIVAKDDKVFPIQEVVSTAKTISEERTALSLPEVEIVATKEIAGVQRHHHSWTAQNALLLALTVRKSHLEEFDYEAVVE